MELLIFLVGRREQMVSREDIVKKLWRSDLFIDTDRNVNNIVRKIRTALGDDSAQTALSRNGGWERLSIHRSGTSDRRSIPAL